MGMVLDPTLDPGASSPLYLQLQRRLRGLIQQGEWRPGSRLPAVPELAQHWGVHRLTVLKALAGLKRTGWIQTVQGRGSFVAPRLPEAPGLRASSGYLFKVLYEAAATPITYAIVAFLKRTEGVDIYDQGTNFSPFVKDE